MDNESELYQETAGAAEETSAAEEAPVKKNAEFFRVVKFVLFSASAGLIEIGSFALLNETLHWRYWVSYIIALALSVLWNFTLNRRYTFRSAANIPVAMLKVAAYLGYQYLVLGAFGCGAFGNDARIVSDLFYKALKEFDFDLLG